MPLANWSPQQFIYKEHEIANEVSILIKGTVEMFTGTYSVTLTSGVILGLTEQPGFDRAFSYKAVDEVTTYSYPYNSVDDIISIIYENEKLAPTISMRIISHTTQLDKLSKNLHKEAGSEFSTLTADYRDYPSICAKNGKTPNAHPEMEGLESPDFPREAAAWRRGFFKTLSENDSTVFYLLTLGPDACSGFVMSAYDYIQELSADIVKIHRSLDEFRKKTTKFKMEVDLLKSGANAIASGDRELTMPNMENSLMQILVYSEVDETVSTPLTQAMESYTHIEDRSDTSDTLRSLRRTIAANFYQVYEAVFKKYINDPEPSPILKMFLMFGYLDERIVSREDIEALYEFTLSYLPSKGGRIVTILEWLQKVYSLEVEPSLNEFQLEYLAYLREARQNGDITEQMMKDMQNDPDARLTYEIKNVFTLGNRMTFGRVSIFSPVFDSQARMLPLDRSYMSHERLCGELDRIRGLDFSIFYREKMFTLQGSKSTNDNLQMFIHEEQPPFMILFPITGTRLVLWQNIEGRKRNTPARMLMPIFFEEDLSDHFTQLCGEYRWEICKTDQGVHWNDITDPSLTAEYNDFLQFFKKNSQLSADHKDRIRAAIKKHSNNYKRVFVADYLSYMKYESAGNMRLLKQQREMLYKYCPFGEEPKARLMSTPQYEKIISIRDTKQEQKTRPLSNIVLKMENLGETPPAELVDEIEFLSR